MAGGDPIFIIGFQRSGTTLLQALLGAHPRIAAPPEIYFVARVAEHEDYFGDLSDDANLARALHEAINAPLDMLAGCGFDEERLLARLKRGPRNYAALLDTMLRDFAERHGKQRWVEKSAGQPIGAVTRLFPDARIVHIVRDPREVVASSLEVAWTRQESASALADQWRDFTLGTILHGSGCGPSQFLQVRYEDLTRDPVSVMRVVCAFLDEEYDPEMVVDTARRRGTVPDAAAGWQGRALTAVQPARDGAWLERLSTIDKLRVSGVVEPMLMPLGYRSAGVRARLLATPFTVAALARRGRRLLDREPPAMTPEERYAMKRRFIAAQVQRVIDSAT